MIGACEPGEAAPCRLHATEWRLILCDRDPEEGRCIVVCEVFLDALGAIIGWIDKPGKLSVHAVEGLSGMVGHMLDMASALRKPMLLESGLPEPARDDEP